MTKEQVDKIIRTTVRQFMTAADKCVNASESRLRHKNGTDANRRAYERYEVASNAYDEAKLALQKVLDDLVY